MSTNEKELLDQWGRCLDRQFLAVIEAAKRSPLIFTAIEEGHSGVPEIKEQFDDSSNLQQLKLNKDNARKAFDESGPHKGRIAQHAEDLRERDKMLDAAVERISTELPINIGIGGAFAFERDPTGEKIDEFLEALFGVNFAGQRVVISGEEGPVNRDRHLGYRGALKILSRDVFRQAETFYGKGPAYFAQAFRKEQGRIIRDEEIEDRNHLGVTPKESRALIDDDREQIRALNRTATAINDLTTAAAIYDSESPEEIALSREEEFSMESFLNRKESELPDDQRLLYEATRADESMTVARRRLGLPKSTETALRNRFARWAREWRAQQAS